MRNLYSLIAKLRSSHQRWAQQGCAILIAALIMLAAGTAATHANDRPNGEPWEDPSCKDVWRAVVMTEIYPSFTTDISVISEDGASRLFMSREITPTERREMRPFEKTWRTFKRLDIEEASWDRFEPRLTNCTRVGTETGSLGQADHWRMMWSSFPYKAEMEAWISTEHELVTKISRRYVSQWEYPEGQVSIVMTYRDLPQLSVFTQAKTPELSTSCAAIAKTTAAFDSAPAVQITRRFVDNGLGEPFLGQMVITGATVYRRDSGWPWHVSPRSYGEPDKHKNCRTLGHQEVNGINTTVYQYERPDLGGDNVRINIWISDKTHLPVRAHFKRLMPDNGEESFNSYSYDPDVKQPL